MKRLLLGVAATFLVAGCEELGTGSGGQELESWRARTILGGGDGAAGNRAEGRVTGGTIVAGGEGTIYPGRQPLFRDSAAVNSASERTVSLNLVDVTIAEAAAAILGELL